ncbi:hypothetical protein NLG97_g5972 [Lecanicillium saksenae]|uniref:Uncharacterized protein n=1 Tax=Lecanicillium saksenae TaxID=468837 RepID=A0ACC1QU61_9HYPO|nr:hypothetical protein NLG97_g5972 [Lecanicillium saksenae]
MRGRVCLRAFHRPFASFCRRVTLKNSLRIVDRMARTLTDDERRRVQAFHDAMDEAMASMTEFVPERLWKARQAVWDAHPIEDELRMAYLPEKREQYADRLKQTEEALSYPLLGPDVRWGLAIYRVTYDDDRWDRMLAVLNDSVDASVANITKIDI